MKTEKKKQYQQESRTLFDKCDSFFARYEWIWFWILFGITLITCILLYDPRVSAGGDDSTYILIAHDFLKDFKFPTYQGPLYPMMLSVIDAIFGMSVKAFKIFSLLSMLACMYMLFIAFRKRIPYVLLFITLALTSFNSHVLYFASQTYSETFYMFMQSLFLFVFFRFFIIREENDKGMNVKGMNPLVKRHLLLAVVLLGVILTRSVGYSLFLAVAGYFIFYRQWKNLAWSAACILVCFAAYQMLKYLVWGDVSLQASGQGSGLLNKDFYKPELGREDLAGFIERFWTNSNQYLSRFFMAMLGLRETFTPKGYYVETKPVITVLVYLLGLSGLWFSFKQNKYLFFSGIVTAIFLTVSFVVLQTSWNQYRLIVPAYPLMILLLFSAIYYILSLPKLRSFQFLLFVPAVVIFSGMLSDTSEASAKAGKLKDEYSGLTPDWLHYAQASNWSAGHLPKDAVIACRKPSISFIYGKGKKFYGIYSVSSGNFDAFYERWNADSLSFSVVPLEGMNDQMYRAILGRCEARLLLDDKAYFVVSDRAFLQQWSTYYENPNVISSPRDFEPVVKQAAGLQKAVYYPDSLLVPLQRAHVTHLLTANLRLNPNIKNGKIINTVERVASVIQEKYPAIFTRLVQIGEPDDEPAEIYQINWDVTLK